MRDTSTGDPWIEESAAWVLQCVQRRQTVLPKRLIAPGPDASQCEALLQAAAAAPDHERLLPWRFIAVPQEARAALGDVFAQALRERDPSATAEQQAQAREKAARAPLLWLLVVDGRPHEDVPVRERFISAGCAVQNVMLVATAMGFGSALTSGKALDSAVLRRAFALADTDIPVCFLSIGTVTLAKPPRERPGSAQFFSVWTPPATPGVSACSS